jgi:hypothetical protein
MVPWTEDLEIYVSSYAEKAAVLRILHRQEARWCKAWDIRLMAPSITLQLTCAALEGLSGGIPGLVIAMSTTSAVLCALNKYLRFAERASQHQHAASQFGKLYRKLTSELAMNRAHRESCESLIAMTREMFDSTYECSPYIRTAAVSRFMKANGPFQISLPDICNGLSKVHVAHTQAFEV